jgi:small subunit ribosomal protein S10
MTVWLLNLVSSVNFQTPAKPLPQFDHIQLPPRSQYPATFHEIKYGHPAAVLQLRAHHITLLNIAVHVSACAADALNIPISQPVSMPRKRELWTVIKSPFAHKKSQENFDRITYRRLIKAWDATPQTIKIWEQFLTKHQVAGVGMRMVKWERLPLEMIDHEERQHGTCSG